MIPNFHLRSVSLITRHGARSSIYTMPGHDLSPLPCSTPHYVEQHNDTLLYNYYNVSNDMLSHHKRSSLPRVYGLYPDNNKCGGSQLTVLGIQQHLRLGSLLKEEYLKNNIVFNMSNIHVFSTKYQRTFQSAAALTYGLLQNDDQFRLLNISVYRDVFFCDKHNTKDLCKCDVGKKLQEKVQRRTSKRLRKDPRYSVIMEELTTILSLNKKRLPWLSAINDALLAYACHSIPLPSGGEASINTPFLERIWKVLHENMSYISSSYSNQKLQRLLAYPLLTDIVNRLTYISSRQNEDSEENASEFRQRQDAQTDLYVYSSHDMTLTAVKAALLGTTPRSWIPYASRITLELYSDDSTEDPEYYWRVLLNGQDLTEDSIPCKGTTLHQGLCELEHLEDFMENENYFSLFKNKNSTFSRVCS